MALKNSLTINLTSNEIKQILSYCKLNNISDIDNFVTNCFKQGLNIEMYGLLGEDSEKISERQKKQVEIEVIREKKVEVPVEVIKEVEKVVEKIVEKPIEIIIEKPIEVVKEVEKIVYISDDNQVKELSQQIEKLKNELEIEKQNIKTIEVEKEIIKEIKVEDNSKLELIQKTLQTLRKEIFEKNNKIKELETIISEFNSYIQNKPALYHRGSNLNDKLL